MPLWIDLKRENSISAVCRITVDPSFTRTDAKVDILHTIKGYKFINLRPIYSPNITTLPIYFNRLYVFYYFNLSYELVVAE